MSTTMQSMGFNNCDSPIVMRSHDSGKKLYSGSYSFNGREPETFSFQNRALDMEDKALVRTISPTSGDYGEDSRTSENVSKINLRSPYHKPRSHWNDAAVKLQKVYKSFRTRRQLADCAVVVEQKWWKLLDSAELKRSSISFFDIEKPETAISRWSRARMRAAKVGKGLSKDAKARKLALQHWLEAIDPRHRYGHNLQFYYAKWLHCESKQPFFYWLDIGDGKDVNHDRCFRSKLQQQCIKYLGPVERTAYEVAIENGKFMYKQSGKLLHTTDGPKDAKWIFVLSTLKTLYVGQKNKGSFQHSSFLAGGATLSAGRLIVEDGILRAVWPHSGHYLPTEENFQEFILFLREHNVDLNIVKECPVEEEEEANIKNEYSIGANNARSNLPEEAGLTNAESMAEENADSSENPSDPTNSQTSKLSRGLRGKITRLEIPTKDEMLDIFKREGLKTSCTVFETTDASSDDSDEDGYESAEDTILTEEDFMLPKITLFDEGEYEDYAESVPREKILRRIDSHKGMNSYQLAKQLSSRWTTGAGPRIGCMRDYPSELQLWALEHSNLSPKHRLDQPSPRATIWYSPRVPPPTALTPVAVFDKKAARSRLGSDQPWAPSWVP